MVAERYYSHGKLLLTGEYLVLKGARSLAFPTSRGQLLKVSEADKNLTWKSKDVSGEIWFQAVFDENLQILQTSDPAKAEFLKALLTEAFKISGRDFFPAKAETQLEFPRNWGLGSSSSLTYLIARWLKVDPFELFFSTQNGSGYDIACADNSTPLVYTLKDRKPELQNTVLPQVFNDVHFIHLNQKQESRAEVKRFLQRETEPQLISEVSAITDKFLMTETTEELHSLMREHEQIISSAIGILPVKSRLFPDFEGEIKSLGAWGGDFIMALGKNAESYFRSKGFDTILAFEDLSL